MKNTFVLICFLLMVGLAFGQHKKENTIFKNTDGVKMKYAYNLPKNYAKNKEYHVLIAPGGGTADDSNDFLFWGRNTANYDWILIETNATIRPNNMKTLKAFFDHLKQQFKPKGNKFHIMGFSANSAGAFKTVLNLPEYFHSITGVPGHPRTANKRELIKLKNIKVNFIVGEHDGYWLNSAKRFNTTLKELGVEVKLQIVKGGGHVLKEIIGDRFMKFMEWLK
ncbi:hypothetical protein RQM59_00785 [Flavobacteriaceae bacterium S356]|uniref:Alpha/beta hydrolase n=1 Tax=Asprobacillus argus TaxID=3076534 RepID=A0ABU3LCU6_9FLAO|nr:hypothetical protein [Flavobacteriaceae bacterium S356]